MHMLLDIESGYRDQATVVLPDLDETSQSQNEEGRCNSFG